MFGIGGGCGSAGIGDEHAEQRTCGGSPSVPPAQRDCESRSQRADRRGHHYFHAITQALRGRGVEASTRRS